MTINGIGTSVCGSRGDVGWGSFDGMEWFVFLYMPLIPIKPLHTFDWNGEQYRAIPIRWSLGLLARTFFGRWLWGLGCLGIVFLLFAAIGPRDNLFFLALGLPLIALAVIISFTLRFSDGRNRAIRRVLGPVCGVGYCDPATLTGKLLEQVAGEPRLMFGTDTYSEAAETLLDDGHFARALLAARLCVAVDNRAEGEALTNQILNDREVVGALLQVKRDSSNWARVMGEQTQEEGLPPSPPVEEPRRARRRPARDEDDY
jgi:hypothetical protein